MKKILLDTNFFLAPFQLGVNVLDEFERVMNEPFKLMTITPVTKELDSLAEKGKGDDKISARLGKEMAKNMTIIDYVGSGDDAIVDFAATTKDIIVATNDSNLRKRLKEKGIQTIFVRNHSKLAME